MNRCYTSCIGHLAPKKRAVLLITGAAEVGCRRSSWLGWPVGILIAGLLALRSWQTPAKDQDAVLAMLSHPAIKLSEPAECSEA